MYVWLYRYWVIIKRYMHNLHTCKHFRTGQPKVWGGAHGTRGTNTEARGITRGMGRGIGGGATAEYSVG